MMENNSQCEENRVPQGGDEQWRSYRLIGCLIELQVAEYAQINVLELEYVVADHHHKPIGAVKVQKYEIRLAFVLLLGPEADKHYSSEFQ